MSILSKYIKQGCLITGLTSLGLVPAQSVIAQAQTASKNKPARILFLLDGSSSMTYDWQKNETRNKVASRIIGDICDSIIAVNRDVSFGIRAYGTQFPSQDKNCTDTRLEMPFTNADNIQSLKYKANQIRAYGYSPIAYSLQVAAEQDFVYSDDYSYSIILITDGGESCGGDICKIMETLINKKIAFKPYVISLLKDDLMQSQFSCMGEYLTVTNNDEIKTAITKIIGDNRKILEIKAKPTEPEIQPISYVSVDYIQSPNTYIRSTDVMKPARIQSHFSVPFFKYSSKPLEDDIVKDTYVAVDGINSNITIAKQKTTQPTLPKLKKENIPFFKYSSTPIEEDIVKVNYIAADYISHKNKLQKLTYTKPKAPKLVKAKVPYFKYSSTPLTEEIEAVKYVAVDAITHKNKIAKLKVSKPNFKIYHIYKVPHFKYTSTPLQETVVTTTPPPTNPVVKTNNPPVTNNNRPQPKVDENKPLLETKVETVASEKTNLIVRFMSSTGKEYFSSPQMKITNTATKTSETKTRSVAQRQIKPIEIAPGKYDISIGNKKQYAKNVEIQANKDNIVTIIVDPSSISFYYQTDSKRPVKEYRAYVSKRFDEDREVTTHLCTDKLYYDPANYHIEINTLPPTIYNMDLEINTHKVVAISEPGYIAIANTNNLGRIEFWYRLGNSNRFFYAMNVTNGNLNNQTAEFLPGTYEIRYFKNPTDAKLTIVPITIKSNATTTITLE